MLIGKESLSVNSSKMWKNTNAADGNTRHEQKIVVSSVHSTDIDINMYIIVVLSDTDTDHIKT